MEFSPLLPHLFFARVPWALRVECITAVWGEHYAGRLKQGSGETLVPLSMAFGTREPVKGLDGRVTLLKK